MRATGRFNVVLFWVCVGCVLWAAVIIGAALGFGVSSCGAIRMRSACVRACVFHGNGLWGWVSRINLGDYRFFLGGCKIFGCFLGGVVFCCCVIWDFVGYLESSFARGATYFFFASPKKK